jgi:tetratricopeptide (TPR) repeat protein
MKDTMRIGKRIARISLALLLLASSFEAFAIAREVPAGDGCVAWNVNGSLMEGNIRGALQMAQKCIENYRQASSTLHDGEALTGAQRSDVFMVGYSLCMKAQVQSMAQDLNGALQSIREAEKFADLWPSVYKSWLTQWPNIIDVTKGFQLEKSDKEAAAKTWYLDHSSYHAIARVALMELREGHTTEALNFAQRALKEDPEEPTAHYVKGLIFEKAGETAGARDEYKNALDSMTKTQESHDFMPIRVAEAKSVSDRLGASH